MLRILVVEDHTLVREALGQVLLALGAGIRIKEAKSGDQVLEILRENADFDLILLDLALPGTDGFTCLKLLRQQYPKIRVVILSAFSDTPTINRALANGATGFIPKTYSGDDLIRALKHVLAGEVFRPGKMDASQLDNETPVFALNGGVSSRECGFTERQGEVLSLVVKGYSNRDIADKLGLSEGTVKIHLTSIFKVLGVSSRAQAIVCVNRLG
ncbi:MAG: response regulator transcription factor, partial [Zoogloeaceae bacterium]|nr:response regulator transcription factor [Zoogloeaceae bacterium]